MYSYGNDDVTQAHEPRYYERSFPARVADVSPREHLEKERKSVLLKRIKEEERDGEGKKNSSFFLKG